MIGLKFGQPFSLGESLRATASARPSTSDGTPRGISPEGELTCKATLASGSDPGVGVLVWTGCAAETSPPARNREISEQAMVALKTENLFMTFP
jgi:hypothetical protein